MSDQPPAKRRRVAPTIADPMAPTVPVAAPTPPPQSTSPSVAPAAAVPVSAAEPPRVPAAAQPAPPAEPAATAVAAPARRAALRGAPTVPVFVRTSIESKTQFEELADARGLTQRAMFDELVADAWRRHSRAR